MGSNQSVSQKIASAKSNIGELHKQVDQLEEQINKEIVRMESQIDAANYTNLNEICDQIGYHYVDLLSSHFPVKTLENYGRVKLGLVPKPESSEMENYKQTVCKSIVEFYKKKLFILAYVKKELPKCKEQETEIYSNLSDKLQRQGINTDKWIDVYKKIQQFNKNIKYQYSQINNSLGKIRNARSWNVLNTETKRVINLVNQTNSVCMRNKSDLLRFNQTMDNETVGDKTIKVNTAGPNPKRPTKPLPKTPDEIDNVDNNNNEQSENNGDEVNNEQSENNNTENNSDEVNNERSENNEQSEVNNEIQSNEQSENTENNNNEPIPEGSAAMILKDYSSTKKNTLDLSKGTEVTVVKYYPNNWVLVKTSDGNQGYIGNRYLGNIIK